MDESPYIKYCLKKVEEKLGWGNYAQWTDSDFRNLSEIIKNSSGILVSSHTLKRLFGKIKYRSNYNPQIATKEALAKYIGYESWNELKSDVSVEYSNNEKVLNSEPITGNSRSRKLKHKHYYAVSGLIFFLLAAFVIFYVKQGKVAGDYVFEVYHPVGKAPHTATFKYDISKLHYDQAFIDFDHFSNSGKYLMNTLNQDTGSVSRCFHIPGKYDIKLFVDDRLIHTTPVLVESDGWFYYAIEPDPLWNEIPDIVKPTITKRYYNVRFDNLLTGDFVNNGYMHIPHSSITSVDGLSLNYKTHYILARPFNVSLDSCIFEIKFRDEQFGKGVHCSEASFELIGMKGSVNFQIVEPGCLNYAFISVGKEFNFGETKNLQEFEMEFLNSRRLRMEAINNQVVLYRDDKEFYRKDYEGSLGEIVGIHLSSKGTPHYDWIKIHDIKGEIIYDEDFEE